ncbi:S41 family peptidase [Nonlabens ulvanivorans]|uniref:S41 family peptidase n=1 Tax=Nonlabens ulvanivorans TaxID=906888 RepID=UPI0029421D32|nr:S41 family peptidase [Nonlabens ulvanivorans]WOI22668.1 S41 family peptidase [Nonlabens ulvanivorans]
MKKSQAYFPLFLGIAVALGIGLGYTMHSGESSYGLLMASNANKRKLNKLIDIIDQRYVDDVNTDSIVDITVNGILSNLDPHSIYITNDEMEDVADQMRGDFVGIGIRFFVNQDTISVLNVLDGGPSKKAGIKGGDKILYADGKPLFGTGAVSTDVLKGEEGSKVTLGVLRPGDNDVQQVSVVRGNVPINSIEAAYMLNENMGYIKVNRFAESTEEEFNDAIDGLIEKGAQRLTVDLRDNPGGVLSAAIAMADEFLPRKKLILFQKDRDNERKDSYATSDGDFEDKPVYILINENSASASEVVAGALQDNDVGTIIGRRSFGKGLVQQEIKLGDGSAVRLTVSRYYTPTGRSIQRPYDNGNEDYFKEYIDRYNSGELEDAANIEVNDSLKRTTPAGKVVYGGGGIIPDVFVPSADGYVLQTLEYFARTGFADQFANRYLQGDGINLRNMTEKDFMETYSVPELVMEDFIQYAQLYNTSISLPGYRDEISTIIKSALAEQLFDTEAKIKILNRQDRMIQKVLELNK